MKLHKILFRAGLLATLTAGPTVALAAGESAVSENYIVLGILAALVIFAFTRKPEAQAPSSAPCCAQAAEPVAEAEAPAEEAAAEEPAAEEAGTVEASAESEETAPENAG